MTTDINGTVIGIQNNPVVAEILTSSQDGYVLTWDNSDGYIAAKPAVGLQSQTFTSNGTWTCPSNVFNVWLTGFGGAGAGGGGYGTSSGAGGGGTILTTTVVSVIPNMSYDIVIGAGGIGGAPDVRGPEGSETTFGALASFSGASGGGAAGANGGASFKDGEDNNILFSNASNFLPRSIANGGTGSPGAGASAQKPGDLNIFGGFSAGSRGSEDGSYDGAGGGGAGPNGDGGRGGNGQSSGVGENGTSAAANSGAGGGGGGAGAVSPNGGSGGDGGSGQLIVSWIGV